MLRFAEISLIGENENLSGGTTRVRGETTGVTPNINTDTENGAIIIMTIII